MSAGETVPPKDQPTFHLRYVLELFLAGFVGWLIGTKVIVGVLDRVLTPSYGQYDWYEPFISVVNLIVIFMMIGLSIAVTVQFRHPDTPSDK